MKPRPLEIYYIVGQWMFDDGMCVEVIPFRGLAFKSLLSERWVSLRSGVVIAGDYDSEDLRIFVQRPVRTSWKFGHRLPLWFLDKLGDRASRLRVRWLKIQACLFAPDRELAGGRRERIVKICNRLADEIDSLNPFILSTGGMPRCDYALRSQADPATAFVPA